MDALKLKISDRIREFDAPSLLKLLYAQGYTFEDLYFQSNPSLSSSPSLFEEIRFGEKVSIVVNVGLLTAQSPLPTYFRKRMDQGVVDPVRWTRFLGFFDHHLLAMLWDGYVVTNEHLFRHYLTLLAVNSTSTLWHLLQLCFPELHVQVRKGAHRAAPLRPTAILGESLLGKEAILGKGQQITLPILEVILTAEEIDNWPLEIKKRLQTLIFPHLHRLRPYLKVTLVVKNNQQALHLAPPSYLGYRSLGAHRGSFRIRLFSGYVTREALP